MEMLTQPVGEHSMFNGRIKADGNATVRTFVIWMIFPAGVQVKRKSRREKPVSKPHCHKSLQVRVRSRRQVVNPPKHPRGVLFFHSKNLKMRGLSVAEMQRDHRISSIRVAKHFSHEEAQTGEGQRRREAK
jgi:hypothetical protein